MGTGTSFSYRIYIEATPERVWQGLTDPSCTTRYWRHPTLGGKSFPSDWREGSTWDLVHEDVDLVVHDPQNVEGVLAAHVQGVFLLAAIVATVAIMLAISYGLSRMLGLPVKLSILIACGNSICGNSAIAAVAPVIGADVKMPSPTGAAPIAVSMLLTIGTSTARPQKP